MTATDMLEEAGDILPVEYESGTSDIDVALFMMETAIVDPRDLFTDIGLLVQEYARFIPPKEESEFSRRVNLALRRSLISLIETLSKEVHLRRYREIAEERETILMQRSKAEIYARRVQLLVPSTEEEFEAALRWMSEQGKYEDLNLLCQVKKSPPFWSENLANLFNLAQQKILVRLHDPQQELLTVFGLTQSEFLRCLIGTGQEHVSQQAIQSAEILKRIKQSWEEQFRPEALQQWFRRPVPALGGKTPLEAVMEGRAEEVWHILGRLEAIPS